MPAWLRYAPWRVVVSGVACGVKVEQSCRGRAAAVCSRRGSSRNADRLVRREERLVAESGGIQCGPRSRTGRGAGEPTPASREYRMGDATSSAHRASGTVLWRGRQFADPLSTACRSQATDAAFTTRRRADVPRVPESTFHFPESGRQRRSTSSEIDVPTSSGIGVPGANRPGQGREAERGRSAATRLTRRRAWRMPWPGVGRSGVMLRAGRRVNALRASFAALRPFG